MTIELLIRGFIQVIIASLDSLTVLLLVLFVVLLGGVVLLVGLLLRKPKPVVLAPIVKKEEPVMVEASRVDSGFDSLVCHPFA